MNVLWQKLVRPLLFRLDAEAAHSLGMRALRSGIGGGSGDPGDLWPCGEIERFGLKFANPLGVAAGFDKNGVAVNQLASLGFGFVEVGTVTYEPQPGNPKPRIFRLPDDGALINRLGFNNDGAVVIAARLARLERKCVIGVNIGRNKAVPNEEATENYLKTFDLIHPVADYITVNVSSPNTPDLRALQAAHELERLLAALQKRNRELGSRPLQVKIAPDLTDAEIEAIVEVCERHEVAGIVATNTTISRDGLKTSNGAERQSGGLSGRPLADRSNAVISQIYRYSEGRLPVVGVGGIFSGEDAFAKIAAGASLLQAYTGFVYGGPTFATDVIRGLAGILAERGFETLDQVVGSQLVDT